MYDILGDKYLLKSANSILVVCNKQGEPDTEPIYPARGIWGHAPPENFEI